MLEQSVEDYLREQVEMHGGRCEKLVDLSRIGGPDREVQWPKPLRCAGIDKVETKRPGGEPRKTQVRYHEFYARCGVPVYVLDTKGKVDVYIRCRLMGEHIPLYWSIQV